MNPLVIIFFKINELETIYLESLWNVLSLRRVILLTEHGQDPFDQLSESYRAAIQLEDIGKSSNDLTPQEIEKHVIEYIKTNKRYPNLENLFNLLDFLYKFIVYKLIPSSQSSNADDDFQAYNKENEIKYFLSPDSIEILGSNLEFELKEFNLENIRLKNIYQLWRCFVKLFLDVKN